MTNKAAGESAVVLGVDPAKRPHAMAVHDRHDQLLAQLPVANSNDGYGEMLGSRGAGRTASWRSKAPAALARNSRSELVGLSLR